MERGEESGEIRKAPRYVRDLFGVAAVLCALDTLHSPFLPGMSWVWLLLHKAYWEKDDHAYSHLPGQCHRTVYFGESAWSNPPGRPLAV